MPLQATSGAASYDGFGGGVPFTPTYIEDVFSTWLYTGNGSTQTITNGIDLAGKGGLVWGKNRTSAINHGLIDTVRGVSRWIGSNVTDAEGYSPGFYVTGFNSNGFTVGGGTVFNTNGDTYASWTFRKQPKFFDVVTWTGNGANPRQIAHNLGSVPGCIIVKSTTRAENWTVYHRSLGNAARMALNTTDAQVTGTGIWASTTPTSTYFTVSADNLVNFNGDGYVAYLFAHDAGGFGLTGTDNVISCGSFTTDANGQATVSLGYEPQWVLVKNTAVSSSGTAVSWNMTDNMRGMPVGGVDPRLFANTSGAEDTTYDWVSPTATGFVITPNVSSGDTYGNSNYIYIAIRRGPMRTPTTGTSVYNAIARTGTGATATVSGVGFSPDMVLAMRRDSHPGQYNVVADRLRGPVNWLGVNSTEQEYNNSNMFSSFTMNGFVVGSEGSVNNSLSGIINWNFLRAPNFFDVVCYSGTSGTRTVTHNLGVVPELMIFKSRNTSAGWPVYVASLGNNKGIELNTTGASYTTSDWNNTTPTSTVFTLAAGGGATNDSGVNYVAYLFASCPGVSKVGSYTGTGATLQIDCGFTGGARFVLIKRTDSTGSWYVWDSARGIVAGNDPYLLMNSTAAEVTNTDWVDTHSPGFELSNSAGNLVNTNGGTYIFLAIA